MSNFSSTIKSYLVCIFMYAMWFKSLFCEMFPNHIFTAGETRTWLSCCSKYDRMILLVALNTRAWVFLWL